MSSASDQRQHAASRGSRWIEDEGIDFRHLIRDRDSKFTGRFDAIFNELSEADEPVVRTGIRASKMNSFCETFIGHAKSECMNHFACFSLNKLDRIVAAYQRYHNQHRPYQGKGIDNRILDPAWQPPPPIGTAKRQKILGGLLNHYYGDAG